MQRIWICDLKQLGKRNLESVMKRYFSNDSASSMPIICKIIFLYIVMFQNIELNYILNFSHIKYINVSKITWL